MTLKNSPVDDTSRTCAGIYELLGTAGLWCRVATDSGAATGNQAWASPRIKSPRLPGVAAPVFSVTLFTFGRRPCEREAELTTR